MKKEGIGIILFVIGIFLLGSTPTPTGAIIGIPAITSNFIGLIFFLASIILLTSSSVKKKSSIKDLLESGVEITSTKTLVNLLKKEGIHVTKGRGGGKYGRKGGWRKIMYKGQTIGGFLDNDFITSTQSERILTKVSKYIRKGKHRKY